MLVYCPRQVLIIDSWYNSWYRSVNETYGYANLTQGWLHDIILEYKQERGIV